MTIAFETPKAIVAGGAVFSYLESGAGPAIVLLHGVGSGARSWKAQLADLSGTCRVVAWDAPGYGSSTPLEPERPDASDYAGRLRSLVDALQVDRFHLVGHSLGAIKAARFACEHPDRVMSLTLAGPSTGHARLSPEERDRLRNGRIDDLAKLGPRGMAQLRGPRLVSPLATEQHRHAVIETMARVRPDGYRQAVALLSGADTGADIARLAGRVPLQFVYGEHDVVMPPESTLALARQWPDAMVHRIDGAGHAMYLEQPQAFNDLLRRFMGATPARRDAMVGLAAAN